MPLDAADICALLGASGVAGGSGWQGRLMLSSPRQDRDWMSWMLVLPMLDERYLEWSGSQADPVMVVNRYPLATCIAAYHVTVCVLVGHGSTV